MSNPCIRNETSYPPFPANIPLAKLSRISLLKLLRTDRDESERLLSSCRTSGFFFLDLRGVPDGEALLKMKADMFGLGATLLNQEREEKMKYVLREGTTHGYKPIGLTKIDSTGTPDRCEFWSISLDSIRENLSAPSVPIAIAENNAFLKEYTSRAHSVCSAILTSLENSLRLPSQSLTAIHRIAHPSGSQAVILRMPPQSSSDSGVSLRAHTDAGTLTLLFNVLGGLQILTPGRPPSDVHAWEFVRPEPGCAIVNLGDAIVEFTNGYLRSGLHRVIGPPGEQTGWERWSLAYGMRPESEVVMKAVEGGLILKDATEKEGYTAREWIVRKMVSMKSGIEAESIGGIGTR